MKLFEQLGVISDFLVISDLIIVASKKTLIIQKGVNSAKIQKIEFEQNIKKLAPNSWDAMNYVQTKQVKYLYILLEDNSILELVNENGLESDNYKIRYLLRNYYSKIVDFCKFYVNVYDFIAIITSENKFHLYNIKSSQNNEENIATEYEYDEDSSVEGDPLKITLKRGEFEKEKIVHTGNKYQTDPFCFNEQNQWFDCVVLYHIHKFVIMWNIRDKNPGEMKYYQNPDYFTQLINQNTLFFISSMYSKKKNLKKYSLGSDKVFSYIIIDNFLITSHQCSIIKLWDMKTGKNLSISKVNDKNSTINKVGVTGYKELVYTTDQGDVEYIKLDDLLLSNRNWIKGLESWYINESGSVGGVCNYVQTSYSKLKKVLGPGIIDPEGDKVTVYWCLRNKTDDEVCIYNWKATQVYGPLTIEEFLKLDNYNWHIGGKKEKVDEFIKELMKIL